MGHHMCEPPIVILLLLLLLFIVFNYCFVHVHMLVFSPHTQIDIYAATLSTLPVVVLQLYIRWFCTADRRSEYRFIWLYETSFDLLLLQIGRKKTQEFNDATRVAPKKYKEIGRA